MGKKITVLTDNGDGDQPLSRCKNVSRGCFFGNWTISINHLWQVRQYSSYLGDNNRTHWTGTFFLSERFSSASQNGISEKHTLIPNLGLIVSKLEQINPG